MKTNLTETQKKYYEALLSDLARSKDVNSLVFLDRCVLSLNEVLDYDKHSDKFKQWYLGLWEDKVSKLVDMPRLKYMKVELEGSVKGQQYYRYVGNYVSLALYFNDAMRKYMGEDYANAFKFNGNVL